MNLAIVTALPHRQPLAQTGINASPLEMGAMQGKMTVFSTHSSIEGQQWPTQSQLRPFQSGAQRQPCCLHPSGAPTHLPLFHPFCWSRTYLHCRKWHYKMKVSCRIYPATSGKGLMDHTMSPHWSGELLQISPHQCWVGMQGQEQVPQEKQWMEGMLEEDNPGN